MLSSNPNPYQNTPKIFFADNLNGFSLHDQQMLYSVSHLLHIAKFIL